MTDPTERQKTLSSEDFREAPFEVLEREAAHPCLLVADHASADIPDALSDLGLNDADRYSHLAWDIGTDSLIRALSQKLQLPAVICSYSRLVVDCNRSLDDPSAFLSYSDAREIHGNKALSRSERELRADAVYYPYHRAVAAQLTALERQVERAAIVSVHSFTPVLNGKPRPWDCGILWDKDPRLPEALLNILGAIPSVQVGDNQPYSGRSAADYTVDYHGESEGRAHVAIEVRQDHLASPEGVDLWADRLCTALQTIISDPSLYTRWQDSESEQVVV
ncbi:MAG: N-formylglutamate amidohydrolase [Pseudomonadota bacterium]